MADAGAHAPAAPRHAIAAVTHPDPYPYYADLVANRPFHFDAELKAWVASSAEAVTAVLTHPAGRVRPIGEPVPAALRGSGPGNIFGALIRMNDGESRHDVPRRALTASVEALGDPDGRVEAVAAYRAHQLADQLRPAANPDSFLRFSLALPTHVIGGLLGVPEDGLDELTRLIADLSASFSASDAGGLARGEQATKRLREIVQALLRGGRETSATPATSAASPASAPDASRIAREAERVGWRDEDAIAANAIGFMTQAQDAVAALIAATLLALARRPRLREALEREPARIVDLIEEVLRFDAPVQNTRRYLAEPATILGQPLPAGTAILVVLAAANRDPLANPQPAIFELTRPQRRHFTFGLGPHACLGWSLAVIIARAGVARILAGGLDTARIEIQPAYRPFPNIRSPLLAWTPRR